MLIPKQLIEAAYFPVCLLTGRAREERRFSLRRHFDSGQGWVGEQNHVCGRGEEVGTAAGLDHCICRLEQAVTSDAWSCFWIVQEEFSDNTKEVVTLSPSQG